MLASVWVLVVLGLCPSPADPEAERCVLTSVGTGGETDQEARQGDGEECHRALAGTRPVDDISGAVRGSDVACGVRRPSCSAAISGAG
eukprot:946840-Rhodomonas_salina.1